MVQRKILSRQSRKRRIRAVVRGTAVRPRLSVYRSLRGLHAQLIDDGVGRTLVVATLQEAKAKHTVTGAKKVGSLLAKKAKEAGVETVVFDRNAYAYHGKVRALAEGAREGGLSF